MNSSGSQLDTFLRQLEELWHDFDVLLDDLAGEGWNQPHGRDWTFADVPYHMYYFDREVVANPLERGGNVPEAERELVPYASLAEWNARKFAERLPAQTPAQSVEQWRAERERIRRLLATMTDADLMSQVWEPLAGLAPAVAAVVLCRTHTYSEFIQLRIHMQRAEPVVSAATTHAVMATMLGWFPDMLNQERAGSMRFNTVLEFTQPGVGPFTLAVADGQAKLIEGRVENPDLVMTQSPETFIKTWNRMHDPAEAMARGEIRVSDLGKAATYAALFTPADASQAQTEIDA